IAILMAAISDAVLAVDRSGNTLFFNSRFSLSFVNRESPTQTPRLSETFREPEILNAFEKMFEQGRLQKTSFEYQTAWNPSPRFYSLSVAPLRRENGEIYGGVGVFH